MHTCGCSRVTIEWLVCVCVHRKSINPGKEEGEQKHPTNLNVAAFLLGNESLQHAEKDVATRPRQRSYKDTVLCRPFGSLVDTPLHVFCRS